MYYIIWIEGLTVKTGEKILKLGEDYNEYTTYMTKALRVKEEHKRLVFNHLRSQGIAENFITFVSTNYAPAGTIFNPTN
jgi:hypothetical protein